VGDASASQSPRLTESWSPAIAPRDPKAAYIALLKLCLTGLAVPRPMSAHGYIGGRVPVDPLQNPQWRRYGRDWPLEGFTMIGTERLDNIQRCIEDVLERDVSGDIIEAGVWRGGASIFMRALLALHGDDERTVFVADSFEGVPAPDPESYPADRGAALNEVELLSASLEEVQGYFKRFGLLDDQVRFVKGWFRDTLPGLAGHPWSVIRLDGDLYESTIIALESMYPSLSPGGYLIVDDFYLAPCRAAVEDYRRANDIHEPIQEVDWTGVYWQKGG
jgi:O-methyltransferase